MRYNPHAALGNADSFGNRNYLLHGAGCLAVARHCAFCAPARLCSIVLGAVTVVFAYLMGRQLAPDWELAAALAAALVAFNPQFLFLSASVSNDNLVTAISAACGCVCAPPAAIRGRRRALVALGAVVGLAALAKLSGLLLGALALTALGLRAGGCDPGAFGWEQCALVVVVAVAVAAGGTGATGPWSIRWGWPACLQLPARAEP